MLTLSFPIELDEETKLFIKDLQKIQSPMIRTAYKQAEYGCTEISVREEVRDRFNKKSELDSWFQQSAVKSGIGAFKSDKALNKVGRIFGSERNFIKRCKGLISNEEWKDARLLPVYLIGEALPRGNRKFDFHDHYILFKPWKGKEIIIDVPKLNKNYRKIWEQLVIKANNKELPLTISLTPTKISISYEEELLKNKSIVNQVPIKNRYAGIDLNPNYIGISVFDDEKLVETKLFCIKELTGKHANSNKIGYETIKVTHAIGSWLKNLRVEKVFIEELSFKQGNSGLGKNFNRLTKNQWNRSKFESTLFKYFKLKKTCFKINAAYTSTIGNLLQPDLPDPVAASTEIAKRGYRLIIKKSKKFYPELPILKELEDRWKETEFPIINSWKDLHDFIKNSKLKYRVPIPEREGFRIFQSKQSKVYVL